MDNLNNTPKFLNLKKRDAFKSWRAGRDESLRDALLSYNVAANHRAKICVAFEEAAEWLVEELERLEEESNAVVFGGLAEGVWAWREKTG